MEGRGLGVCDGVAEVTAGLHGLGELRPEGVGGGDGNM